MPSSGIHGTCSVNWKAAVEGSQAKNRGKENRKLIAAVNKATIRIAPTFSLSIIRIRSTPIRGRYVITDNMGKSLENIY